MGRKHSCLITLIARDGLSFFYTPLFLFFADGDSISGMALALVTPSYMRTGPIPYAFSLAPDFQTFLRDHLIVKKSFEGGRLIML